MSNATVVAEKSALVCFSALSFATGAGAGVAPFAASLAVLATIGIQFRSGRRTNCYVAAQDSVLRALSKSRDFSDEDLARAAVLLEDRSRKIRIEPARMVEAAGAGGANGFDQQLARHLMRGLPIERGDDAVRRAIEIAFVTAIAACRRHPDIDRDLTQTLLIESARNFGVVVSGLERVEAKIDDLVRLHEQRHSDATRITEIAVRALARRIAPEIEDTELALHELERAVEIAVRVQSEGWQLSNLGDFVDEVLRRSAELAEEGDYDAADAEIEEALQREAEESKARRLRLLERGVDTALLRRDSVTAAARIARRTQFDLLDGQNLCNELLRIQDDWYTRGRDKGLNLDLEVSIHMAHHAMQSVENGAERGKCLNHLGASLAILGERESGTDRLEEAVAAYRAALEEQTRERMPLDWAATQMNLGVALTCLGGRESGTARLEEAVASYRLALEEQTRDRVPLDWAATQMNLGTALAKLGERDDGTARLEESVASYRAALEERTRDRLPLGWALTQNNLGTSLASLAVRQSRDSGIARLEEAVVAYRAALEERTRERVPLDWAATQMNLGTALRNLGHQESGTARLKEAITAYRAALEELTRERVPLDWAMTQMNLGTALADFGKRESGTAWLEEAVTAYRLALEEVTRERLPQGWAMIQLNLCNALTTLGERESGTARLEEAVDACRVALKEYTENSSPYFCSKASVSVEKAQQILDERRAK